VTINVTLKHLRGFVAVAEEGSYTRAAERLHLTQSSLTATIKQLEQALGLALFDRTTRYVALTAQGRDLLPGAKRLLQEFDTTVRDIRAVAERRKGHAVVAGAPSVVALLLPRVIHAFRERYPDIRIGARDGGARAIQQWVLDSEVDFAITNKWGDDPGLDFKPLLRDRFQAVASRQHALARSRQATWKQLDAYPQIGLAPHTGIQALLNSTRDLPPRTSEPLYRLSSTSALEPLVRQNLGIAVLPALAAHMIASPELVFVPLGSPVVERELCVITRRGRALSPAAQTLLQMTVDHVKAAALPPGVRLVRG
jgi:DNA-binding transcriptional LysR family regulator